MSEYKGFLLQGDCLEVLKTINDNTVDVVLTDPPYFLGTKWEIDDSGQYVPINPKDFLEKWEIKDGHWWQEVFRELLRVLKHGGYVVMFSIDRQSDILTYQARLMGFEVTQKLYWLTVSSMPKSTDTSKNIDKRLKVEREVVGERKAHDIRGNALMEATNSEQKKENSMMTYQYTKAASPLAKKYEGTKYSISPLKQILEEVLVFRKECKNGSVLNDIFAKNEAEELRTEIKKQLKDKYNIENVQIEE